MATFECPIVKVRAIEPIPGADAIELAVIGEYRSVVRKDSLRQNEMVVYLPEASVLPEWLIEKLGLTGKLAGSAKNRIKAIKLRGCLSQGIVLPLEFKEDLEAFGENEGWTYIGISNGDSFIKFGYGSLHLSDIVDTLIGKNVAEKLGVTKYEPPIPVGMAGEVANLSGYCLKFDVENFKKNPDVLIEGEEVVITEKLHGTCSVFGFVPGLEHDECGDYVVHSKGLGASGLAFKFNDNNANNIYVRTFFDLEMSVKLANARTALRDLLGEDIKAVYFLGEIFGKGVQDLAYGTDKPIYRGFDIYVGLPGRGRYLDRELKEEIWKMVGIEWATVLYKGPFSKEELLKHTDGNTTISDVKQIREGVVVTPMIEREDPTIGRVLLKNVSADYLLRKGDATEYS